MVFSKQYDVALTFASEDRGYAEILADILRQRGVSVFYDRYELATLWGKNLYTYLSELYQHKAKYCVMFLSQHYATNLWTNHERAAAQARAFQENEEYILPIRLDNTEIPGVLPTTAYLNWQSLGVEAIANAILEKLELPSQLAISGAQNYDRISSPIPHTLSKIKVLIIFANPRDTSHLRLGTEDRVIREAIKLSHYRTNIEIITLHAATIHDLRRSLLEETFQIVHLSGHSTNKGLILEDEQGKAYIVPQEALAELFKAYSPPLKCVLLNACYSLSQGHLISLGVPYTIAMEGPISDKAAIEFARGFYDAVGAGRDIDFAYEEGRRAVKLAALNTFFESKMLKS